MNPTPARSPLRESHLVSRSLILLLCVLAASACQTPTPPLEVAGDVDPARYAGRWYEIASLPQRFQRGCVATTATYELLEGDRIGVVNECRDGAFDGPLRRVEGEAWPEDPEAGFAKLRVRFFWPFSGSYWIIELDPEYRYAVVGHPSRDYLWILSRTPSLASETYDALVARAKQRGFDVTALERTAQPIP